MLRLLLLIFDESLELTLQVRMWINITKGYGNLPIVNALCSLSDLPDRPPPKGYFLFKFVGTLVTSARNTQIQGLKILYFTTLMLL